MLKIEQIAPQFVFAPEVLFKNCKPFVKKILRRLFSSMIFRPSSLENKKALRSSKILWMLPTRKSCSKSWNCFSSNMQMLLKSVMLSNIFVDYILGSLNSVSMYLWVWLRSTVWFHSFRALSTIPKNSLRDEFPFRTVSMLMISSRLKLLKSRLYKVRW